MEKKLLQLTLEANDEGNFKADSFARGYHTLSDCSTIDYSSEDIDKDRFHTGVCQQEKYNSNK